jgi:hypothetical protein
LGAINAYKNCYNNASTKGQNPQEKKSKMIILGAGLAGLLAANYFQYQSPVVLEKQKSIPNNHHALLRFREPAIAEFTRIPFEKVRVDKAINYQGELYSECNIKMANMYSKKVNGVYNSRSIWNLETVDRYISPSNLIRMLSSKANIQLDASATKETILTALDSCQPVISTLPMNVMAEILGIKISQDFKYKEIITVNASLKEPCNVYQTVYYPNPTLGMYRMSITGQKVIAEFIWDDMKAHPRHGVSSPEEYIQHFLENDFGIISDLENFKVKTTKYGKITPIDDLVRKKFIKELTDQYGVYSLGRYATWRNLLLDDVFEDLKVVESIINGHGYFTGNKS